MKCEVEKCGFHTEHNNSYEQDNVIMTRHLRAHTVMEIRALTEAILNAPRGPYGEAQGALPPEAVPDTSRVSRGPLKGSVRPRNEVEPEIKPMK